MYLVSPGTEHLILLHESLIHTHTAKSRWYNKRADPAPRTSRPHCSCRSRLIAPNSCPIAHDRGLIAQDPDHDPGQ